MTDYKPPPIIDKVLIGISDNSKIVNNLIREIDEFFDRKGGLKINNVAKPNVEAIKNYIKTLITSRHLPPPSSQSSRREQSQAYGEYLFYVNIRHKKNGCFDMYLNIRNPIDPNTPLNYYVWEGYPDVHWHIFFDSYDKKSHSANGVFAQITARCKDEDSHTGSCYGKIPIRHELSGCHFNGNIRGSWSHDPFIRTEGAKNLYDNIKKQNPKFNDIRMSGSNPAPHEKRDMYFPITPPNQGKSPSIMHKSGEYIPVYDGNGTQLYYREGNGRIIPKTWSDGRGNLPENLRTIGRMNLDLKNIVTSYGDYSPIIMRMYNTLIHANSVCFESCQKLDCNGQLLPPGKEKLWKDLTEEEIKAAEVLGYTGKLWDSKEETGSTVKFWSKLSKNEKEAAELLGYSGADWDKQVRLATPSSPAGSVATSSTWSSVARKSGGGKYKPKRKSKRKTNKKKKSKKRTKRKSKRKSKRK